ncbi:hypothetical protein [Frigoriflavimonas asaccharolytica]|uniref:Uncharacterized protein n=1 Tax=Frigoriflavimonas asaccharolytica TaxID=2735899 RepID=A0A8J8G7E1_9FLAO|nr:hypothetical protein [Frigoriflavimonas asaccharolytica]NRS92045.1 hypothetical protein [Frigoriflavimonas asaccharolytica]
MIQKLKNEASNAGTILWKKSVEKLFSSSTTVDSVKLENIFTEKITFTVKNEQGKRIEFLGGFYQCFIIYDAEKENVLEYLNNLKTYHPEISDESYTFTDQQMIEEKLNFIKSKFPDIYQELGFFTTFRDENTLEYYSINRYPYANILIFDKTNNKIYHFIENYQD